MELRNKTVLLTGAAGGIGRVIVDALLAEQVEKIIACDISATALESVFAREHDRVVAYPLDVSDETAAVAASEAHPDVDILINCHGVVRHESCIEAVDIADFRREREVNFWGQVIMCRAFAGVLAANGGGAMVNFLSPLAYITYPFCASYCASKAACRVLTDSMRAELAAQGTFVMGVCPGSIDTPMMEQIPLPKSQPEIVALALIEGLVNEVEEIWPGPDAQEMREKFAADPQAMAKEAAAVLPKVIRDMQNS